MELYVRKLDVEDIANLVIEDKLPRLGNDNVHIFVVCDKPLKHYRVNPLDYFRIGSGVWSGVEEAYLHSFEVQPEYRRQGLGQKLVKASLVDIAEKGVTIAKALTLKSNDSINRILSNEGFEIEKEFPKTYKHRKLILD
ncbi:MAG: GNAT family N-acetyltransferase [Nanoarchaeota archaeon]|nr:GNAT family N-acetyltransferase [Nanoarchaeota archaeon]